MLNKILLVEDDPEMVRLLNTHAADIGYEFDWAEDGIAGLDEALKNNYSMVIADINMPRLNGLELCKRLRKERSGIPIILLTSRSEEIDKVLGFELGADDYITKPFSMRELVVRIHAILRRAYPIKETSTQSNEINDQERKFGPLVINLRKHTVSYDGKKLFLSGTEYDVLVFLSANPGKVFSRDELMVGVWGYQASNFLPTVTMYLSRVRNKVEPDPAAPRYIHTIRNSGYCFEDRGDPE